MDNSNTFRSCLFVLYQTRFEFEVDEKKYALVFNLNVMESIQAKYGSVQKWGKLTDNKNGEIIFFLMNIVLFLCIHRGFCEKNIIFASSF